MLCQIVCGKSKIILTDLLSTTANEETKADLEAKIAALNAENAGLKAEIEAIQRENLEVSNKPYSTNSTPSLLSTGTLFL